MLARFGHKQPETDVQNTRGWGMMELCIPDVSAEVRNRMLLVPRSSARNVRRCLSVVG
jgi:hypothetical protein